MTKEYRIVKGITITYNDGDTEELSEDIINRLNEYLPDNDTMPEYIDELLSVEDERDDIQHELKYLKEAIANSLK